MFKLDTVSKQFGSHRVFEDVNLDLYPQEKVALIGPRGSGKSTLLRIMAGMESYQQGHVSPPAWTWVGYLPQEAPRTNQTVVDMFQAARDDYFRIKGKSLPSGCPPCLAGINVSHSQHGLLDCHASCGIGPRCRLMTLQLGIQHLLFSAKLSALEPAERKRLWLAGLLLASPDVLLLDEPTDVLDIPETEWLERFLQNYKETLVIVSKDRSLLDHVSSTVWEIDPERYRVHRWKRTLDQTSLPAQKLHIITGMLAFPMKTVQSHRRKEDLVYAS